MAGARSSTPTWLETQNGALAAWVHAPADGTARGGVVICPPLGEEVTLAYSGLRMLADQLTDAGFVAIRFAYPGTGDSADVDDPSNHVDAWRQATLDVVEFVRSLGCHFVALSGLRLGATLAAEVASRCGTLDALMLWDPYVSGRAFLRGQKALQTLESGPPAPRADGSEEAAGYVYSAATLQSIRAMSLSAIDLNSIRFRAESGSCQLLVRPEEAANPAVAELARSPQARLIDAPRQPDFLGKPSFGAVIPRQTLGDIVKFVDERARGSETVAVNFVARETAVVGRTTTGEAVTEQFISLGPEQLFGIVTEVSERRPPDCTLLCTNVSAEHHIGPHRAWVVLARALAGNNVRTIRYDRLGVGDSDPGDRPDDVVMYTDEIRKGTIRAAESVLQRYSGPVAAIGSCSGAWAVATAAEARFGAVWLINPGLWRLRLSGIKGSDIAAQGDRTVQEQQSERRSLHRARAAVKKRMPYFAWRLAGRFGEARVPEIVLGHVARFGTKISVILAPTDAERFAQQRGEVGVARLRRRGVEIAVKTFEESDHALLHEPSRREILDRVRAEIVALYGRNPDPVVTERVTH